MELKELAKDYRENFVGKSCQVSTNYKHLSHFIVTFQITDLHHLFGLHKLTRDIASHTMPRIEIGELKLKQFKQLSAYREVSTRVGLYPFIHEVFSKRATEYCVIRKDLSRNSMNLDLVFFEGNNRNVTVLGLRKSKDGTYRLVTLHESSASKYTKVRKTRITNLVWL